MSTPLKDQLKAISRAISVTDDYSFSVYERQVHVAYQQPYQSWGKPLDHFGANTGQKDQLRANLKSQLTSVIYSAFYVKGQINAQSVKAWEKQQSHMNHPQDEAFVEELSTHNSTTDGHDPFWRIYAVDQQGNTYVEKNGEVRQLYPNTYEFANASETTPQVNSMVNITRAKEHRDVHPTFYHVNSEELMPVGEEIGRFYWNIEPDGMKLLIEQITETFNRYRVPFMFKCTNNPEWYNRADGAVLYILRKQFRIASKLLKQVVAKVKAYLKNEVPLFTQPLCPGLSYAEDPGMNQSFGMSRSELIAEGIANAYYLRRNNKTAQLQEVLKAFEDSGIDVKQLYRKPNSHWEYDFNFLNQ